MQSMLDCVSEWCEHWQMKINMGKTKIIEFRKKGTPQSIVKFKLGDKVLEKCVEYKYLGVYLDEFLEFKRNYEVLTSSGQRGLGALIAKFKSISEMGYDTFTKLFFSNVAPITDYGSEIWGYSNSPKREAVDQKAMRIFLGVHKYACNEFLNGEMGWFPTKLRHKMSLLRYWNRLIKMQDNRIAKILFEYEYQRKGFWCETIHSIFNEIDMQDIYRTKSCCDLKLCRELLQNKYVIDWFKLVKKKPQKTKELCFMENRI